MKKIALILSFILYFLGTGFSQNGGEHTYQFLDLDFNSRSMALGGDYALANDGDINIAVANPASINKKMDKRLSLNHAIFPSGINYGQIVYGRNTKYGMFTGHLRYVSYGRFTRTNELGIEEGKFTAGDYAGGIGYGYQLNKYFSIGGNFSLSPSKISTKNSFSNIEARVSKVILGILYIDSRLKVIFFKPGFFSIIGFVVLPSTPEGEIIAILFI